MFGPHLNQPTPRGTQVRLLSSRRRHPAAKGVLLLFALFMTGALYALSLRPAQVSAETGNSQQMAQGKALFLVGCASCHGLNGEGQITRHHPGSAAGRCGRCGGGLPGGTGRMPMAKPGARPR